MTEDEKARDTANSAKIKARLAVEIAETRAELDRWLDRIPDTRSVSTMNALLEAAFDRYIELIGESDAFMLIESAFRRVAKKTRPTLQSPPSMRSQAPGTPPKRECEILATIKPLAGEFYRLTGKPSVSPERLPNLSPPKSSAFSSPWRERPVTTHYAVPSASR
jgi:hypothetical protein